MVHDVQDTRNISLLPVTTRATRVMELGYNRQSKWLHRGKNNSPSLSLKLDGSGNSVDRYL
jgi:hypothetical protein